jgi:hypothetical protein
VGALRVGRVGAAMVAEEGTPTEGSVVIAAAVAEAVVAAMRLAIADSVEAMAGNMHKIEAVSGYHESKERRCSAESHTVFHIVVTHK